MKTKELLFGACLCMFTACNMPEKGMDVDVYEALDYCDAQVQRTLTELKAAEGTIDYSMMPRNIMDSLNTWHCRKATRMNGAVGSGQEFYGMITNIPVKQP